MGNPCTKIGRVRCHHCGKLVGTTDGRIDRHNGVFIKPTACPGTGKSDLFAKMLPPSPEEASENDGKP